MHNMELMHVGMCKTVDGFKIVKYSHAPILFDNGVIIEPIGIGLHGNDTVCIFSGKPGYLPIEVRDRESVFEYAE